jgi:hypothetical protein
MQMYVGAPRGQQASGPPPISGLPLPSGESEQAELAVAGGELLAVLKFEGYITPEAAEAARKQLIQALEKGGCEYLQAVCWVSWAWAWGGSSCRLALQIALASAASNKPQSIRTKTAALLHGVRRAATALLLDGSCSS